MTTSSPLLLLRDGDLGSGLAELLEPFGPACAADAYEALALQSSQPRRAILLPAPREELPALARAVRRLDPRSRVLGCCRPGDRADVLQDAGEDLDDLLDFPPSRGELAGLLMDTSPGKEPPQLPLDELIRLIGSTHKLNTLEDALAGLVGKRLKREVAWIDAEQRSDDQAVLLNVPSSPPRLLVVRGPVEPQVDLDTLLAQLQRLLPTARGLAQRIESLHRLAITDHLTNAYNRRYFYHLVDHVLRRAQRQGFRAALLLYDIDDFKQYNDRFGHATGDEILRDTARLIQQITREQDIVARIGGDEFAVLFWDSEVRSPDSDPLTDAWDLADRFRRAVESHAFSSLGPGAHGTLTISGGLASFPDHGRTCLELLRQADLALRTAKAEGKNAVHLVGQP